MMRSRRKVSSASIARSLQLECARVQHKVLLVPVLMCARDYDRERKGEV